MLLKRQQILLTILRESEHPISFSTFHYLVALISQLGASPTTQLYDFIALPEKLHSLQLEHEVDQLVKKELISTSKEGVISNKLSKTALDITFSVPFQEQQKVIEIIKPTKVLTPAEIIKHVKNQCPRLFRASTRQATPKIFTAGYEGETIDSFLKKLLANGIQRIIDVRKNPISRKFGFSKKSMSESALQVGIYYIHFPELGIPSESRKNLKTKEDYIKLFDGYENSVLTKTTEKQIEVAALLKEKPSVLICFEHDPRLCHRGRLAAKLHKDFAIAIGHI